MKSNLIARTLLTAAIIIGSIAAYAQSQQMRANIPFDFKIENTYLPAGEYIVTAPGQGVLLLTNAETRKVMTVIVHSAETLNADETGKLVFHRYGETYFLSQVWRPGNNFGQELPRSAAEREWASAHHEVTLAMVAAR